MGISGPEFVRVAMSSTYKKIRRLQDLGIVSIERIDIDNNGKRVLYYRSKIRSLELNVTRDKILLQFERNVRCSTQLQR